MSEEILTVQIETQNTSERFSARHLSQKVKETLQNVIEMIKKETIE